MRKHFTVETGKAILHMPDAEAVEFDALSAIVADMLAEIAELPILPSEAEDILSLGDHITSLHEPRRPQAGGVVSFPSPLPQAA